METCEQQRGDAISVAQYDRRSREQHTTQGDQPLSAHWQEAIIALVQCFRQAGPVIVCWSLQSRQTKTKTKQNKQPKWDSNNLRRYSSPSFPQPLLVPRAYRSAGAAVSACGTFGDRQSAESGDTKSKSRISSAFVSRRGPAFYAL